MPITKEFRKGNKVLSFQYEKDPNDSNPASTYTFQDEEIVRETCWYPYIQKNMVVLDIGAAFGSYALPAAAIGAKVHAFTPEHEFPILKHSISLNPPDFQRRIKLYDFGFYDREGFWKTDTMEFIPNLDVESRRAAVDEARANWTGWYIPVTTLDRWVLEFQKIKRVDFIKLDTEGAEFKILQAGSQTLKKFHPKILVEYHIFKDGAIQAKIHELLTGLGYKRIEYIEYTGQVHHGLYSYEKRF
jgi:FkbM family methyltransferase